MIGLAHKTRQDACDWYYKWRGKKVSLFAHVHADSNRYIGIYCCSVVLTLIETRLLERIVKSVFLDLDKKFSPFHLEVSLTSLASRVRNDFKK